MLPAAAAPRPAQSVEPRADDPRVADQTQPGHLAPQAATIPRAADDPLAGIAPEGSCIEESVLEALLSRLMRRRILQRGPAAMRAVLVQDQARRVTAGRPPWAGASATARRFEDWMNATAILFDIASAGHENMVQLCLAWQLMLDRQ